MAELTIAELQEQMSAGSQSARGLVEYYLERIERIDRAGPRLNSVIELNPDAPAMAEALDRERAERGPRGPLHGIPILIKDNIDTADRMQTTAGSLALEGSIARRDAFLVKCLRAAGAIILGKTNLSEWANFRSTHSISGWSSRGGQTRNPYALDRSPCGSSSGSGAATAADLCAAAVGTETDGSIVCPANSNGIVGLKPTLGLVSRAGVIPIAHSQDTAGPMARTVADAAALLGALTGVDGRDPATAASKGKKHGDYTRFLAADGLRGARLGIVRNYAGFDTRVDKIFEACLAALKAQGAVLIDPVELLAPSKLEKLEIEVLYYEFKADLNAYLAGLPKGARVRSMADVIKFNDENRARVMPFFAQERMVKAQAKGPLTQQKYREALARGRKLARESLNSALRKHKLDALVAPTGGPAWLVDLVAGDHYTGGDFSSPAAVAGYPHVSVPSGYVFGLPVGLSFVGGPWSEGTLLKLAFAFEQATRVRRAPQFLAATDLTGPETITP